MTTATARFFPSAHQLMAIKLLVFAACLLPGVLLLQGWFAQSLGANPVESILRGTGDWTLRMLLITLAVTPLRRLTGQHWLLRLRRMLGLFAFAWASAHLSIYLWLENAFDGYAIVLDILDRPFIAIGMAAFVLMLPLALTSSHAAIRQLGGQRWQALHRLVYVVAVFGVVHFWWQTKADYLEPMIYALILGALLGVRFVWRRADRKQRIASARKAQQSFQGIPIVPQQVRLTSDESRSSGEKP